MAVNLGLVQNLELGAVLGHHGNLDLRGFEISREDG